MFDQETVEVGHLPFLYNYRYLSVLLIAFLALTLLVFW